jgi:hypothetical protein
MPEFKDSKWVEVDLNDLNYGSMDVDFEIDIDVYDFLEECSASDIEELIDELEERGYLQNTTKLHNPSFTFEDEEWSKIVHKLSDGYARFRLSKEDIELIKQISNKL